MTTPFAGSLPGLTRTAGEVDSAVRDVPTARSAMRILVYPGTPDCANLGDLAMLQVALERLERIWPEASFQVLTNTPDRLRVHCPRARPVPLRGNRCWLRVGSLPQWLIPGIPPVMRSRFPSKCFWRLLRLMYPPNLRQTRQFSEALFNSRILVLAGCGILNDAFRTTALQILDLFEVAGRCGIQTVMVGQGIGPILDPVLLNRAREVLPRIDALFVRERVATLPLLRRIQVPTDRICFTGDDAMEMVWNQRPSQIGTQIGVSLRLAAYSGINEAESRQIVELLAGKARQHAAEMTGIPILCGTQATSDVHTLNRLAEGLWRRDGDRPTTPGNIISRTSLCRLVVTNTYHAGVFALSQGIPAIGIARSTYYRDKFNGLADQFGGGCVVLDADNVRFLESLAITVERLWDEAENLRPQLLAVAENKVKEGQKAYARLPELLGWS
jgi:polysaccharide pyruvyl transferase WcaK-like protein